MKVDGIGPLVSIYLSFLLVADEFRTLSKNIQQKLERTNDILAEISTKSEASAKATESELSRKNSELKIALDENIKYADIARREAAVMDDLVLEIQEVVGDFALQIAKSGTEPPPPPERRSSKTNVMPTQQQQHHHAGHMHPGNLSDKIALIQLEASKIRRLCSTAEKIMRENELDAEKRLSSAKHEKELSSIQLGNEIQIRDELISSLKMQMSELASEFQVVQERLKDDKVEHHQAQIAELDQARRDCDQLVSQKQKLEVALQDVIKNHSESRSNLDFELNQLRAQLNQTSDSLANEKITNGEQIKDLSVKNKELLEDKSVLSERVEHLLLELEAAKLEHRRLESISRESEAQARAKIDELTGKIDAANAQIRQEQQRLSTISSTDSRFKNAISNLSSALNELRGTTRKTVLSNPVLSFKISSQEDFSGLSNTSSSFREAIGIVSAQSELKLSSIEDDLKKEIAKLTELQSNNLNELSDDIVNQLITVSRQKSLDSKQIIFSLKSFLMDSLNQLGEDLDNCVGNLIKKIERQSGKLVNAEKNYSDVSEENIQLKNIVRKMKASGGLVTSSPSSSTTPATKNNDHVIAGDDSMSSSNNAAVLMVPISTSSKFGFASVSEDLHLEKVSSLEQKCRKLQDELQSTRRRLEEEQVLRREASKKLQDIEMETSARHDSMVSQYDNRVSASLATIRDLQEKLVHTEKLLNFHRLESVKNESSFTMERQDLVGRIEVLKENCAQLNRAVDAATAKITVQHQKIGELQSLLISNEGKDSDIKGELENVKSTLSSTTRSFEARRRSDQDKINSLSNMLSEARLELLNKGNSFDSEKLLKSFQDEVQMKQDQLSKLRKEIDDLHSSRRDLDSRRHDAESQLSRTLTQKYDLEKELDTLTFEKSAWVAEKAHLIQRLEWLGNQAALHKQHQAENAENMEKMYSELDSALKGVVTDNNNRIFAAATSSPSASMSPQHTQSASISANLNSSHPPFTLNIPSSNSDQFYLHRFMMKLAEIISAQKQSTDIKFGQLEKNLKEIKNYLTSSRSPSLDSFDVSSMQQAASTVSDEKGAEETSATSAQGYIPRHLLHFSPALDRRATRKAEKITSEVFRQALEEAESKIVSLERERIVQKNDIERLLKKTDYIKKKYKAASEARIRKILTAMEIQSRERDNVQLHNKLNQDDLKDMYESQISDLVSELKLAKSVIIKEKMATASVAAAAAAAVASTPTTSNNTPIFPNLFSATTMTPGGKSPLIDIDLQVEKIISVASGTNSKRRYSFMP